MDDLGFDVDEHGILKGSSHGSPDQGLDDDGIWKDEYTYHTDSGFGGTVDRKSSSSTINMLNKLVDPETESFRLLPAHIRNEIGYDEDCVEGSVHADERSLNISELEASESVAGEYSPFDAQSLGSGANYDFPELHDESYMIDSEASRPDSRPGSRPGRTGSTSTYSRRESELSHIRDDEEYRSESSDDDGRYFEGEKDHLPTRSPRVLAPPAAGESIFSQETPVKLLPHQQLSLMEFEELEAAVQGSDGEIDHNDLIGAYLQGLKEREEEDEAEEEEEITRNEQGAFDQPMHRRSTGNIQQPEQEERYWSDGEEEERRDQYDERGLLNTMPSTRSGGFNNSTGEGFGSSIPFEESLIENQQPPFDSIQFSTGEMPRGGHGSPGADEYDRSRSTTPKPTRIPMLRSRSPSLSRPGSSLSRPGSPSPVRGLSGSTGQMYRPGSPGPMYRSGSPGDRMYRSGSPGIPRYIGLSHTPTRDTTRSPAVPRDTTRSPGIPRYRGLSPSPTRDMSRSPGIPRYRGLSPSPTRDMTGSPTRLRPARSEGRVTGNKPMRALPVPTAVRGRSLPPTPRRQHSGPDQRHSPMGHGDRDSASPRSAYSPVHRQDASFQSEVSEMEKATTLLFGDDEPADMYDDRHLSADRHASADMYEDRHLSADSYEDKRLSADTYEDNHMSADMYEDNRASADMYENSRKSADTYADRHRSTGVLAAHAKDDLEPEVRQRPSSADVPGAKLQHRSLGGATKAKTKSQGSVAVNHSARLEEELKLSQLEEIMDVDVGLSQQSAVSERSRLKSRLTAEESKSQMNEETLDQLHKEYDTLLAKYAKAENTIDALRLGAKVQITYDGTANPGQAQAGSVTPAQHAQSFNIPQKGTASVINPTPMAAQMGSMHGSRPGSRTSMSGSVATSSWPPGGPTGSTDHTHVPSLSVDETSSIAEEGAKLALLAKAKALEDQYHSFQTLLDHDEYLSLGDQEKALKNIRDGMEQLQQDYRDAKEDSEFMRRQGLSGEAAEGEFDENKDVEGELYKLNMKLDDLEHRVQENLKQKSTRVPYKGPAPVKADHNIHVPAKGTSTPVDGQEKYRELDRPPSQCSLAGSAGEFDEQIQKLNHDYSNLMDQYKRLKDLKKTPERDAKVNGLLGQLKNIYDQTPDHRKPDLPAELQNEYDSQKAAFKPKSREERERERRERQEQLRQNRPRRDRDRDRSTRDRTSRRSRDNPDGDRKESQRHGRKEESDLSSPERNAGGRRSEETTSDYTSGMSAAENDRKRRMPPTPQSRDGSRGSRRSEMHRKLPAPGPKRRDPRTGPREDKDSGYVGSESSRKTADRLKRLDAAEAKYAPRGRGATATTSSTRKGGSSGPRRTNALDGRAEYYSDSDSGSSADTVEERPYTRADELSADSDVEYNRGELSVNNLGKPSSQYRQRKSPSSGSGGRRGHKVRGGHRSPSSSDEEVRTISEGRHSSSSDRARPHGEDTGHQKRYGSSEPRAAGKKQGHLVVAPQPIQPGQQPQQQPPAGATVMPGAQQPQYYYYPAGYQYDATTGQTIPQPQQIPQQTTGTQQQNSLQHQAVLQASQVTRGHAPVLTNPAGAVHGTSGVVNGQVLPQQGVVINGQVPAVQQQQQQGVFPQQQAGYVDPNVYVTSQAGGGYVQDQTYASTGALPAQYTQPQGQRSRGRQRSRRGHGDQAWGGEGETWAGDDQYYSNDPYREDMEQTEGYAYDNRQSGRPRDRYAERFGENKYSGESKSSGDKYWDRFTDSKSRERLRRLHREGVSPYRSGYYSDPEEEPAGNQSGYRSRGYSSRRHPGGSSSRDRVYDDPADLGDYGYGYYSDGGQYEPDPYDPVDGVDYGGAASGYQHTAIQNVPQTQQQGSQYFPPGGGAVGYGAQQSGSQVTFAQPLAGQVLTNSSAYPGQAYTQSTEGAVYSTQANGQTYQPGAQTYQPGAQTYQPGAQTYQPGAQTYQPGAQTYQPGAQTYQPGAQTYQPAAQTYQPGAQTYQSGAQTYQPAAQTYQPGTHGYTGTQGVGQVVVGQAGVTSSIPTAAQVVSGGAPGVATTAYVPLQQGGNTGPVLVGVPSQTNNNYGVTPVGSGHILQTTTPSSGVRYYVREYAANGSKEGKSSKHKQHRSSRRAVELSDEDDGENLNDSLDQALKTAKQLKKMSRRMKKNLNEEIESSYREVVQGY